MTFVNHTIGGFTVGSVLAWILHLVIGINLWWTLCIINALIGAYPDVGSWVLRELSLQSWWKWKKWERWEMYGRCHPPYDGVHGTVDRIMKWWPSWGLHTWLIDSIVHPLAPKFIFPKFPTTWQNERFLNWKYSKWDVMYAALELFITILYVLILYATKI